MHQLTLVRGVALITSGTSMQANEFDKIAPSDNKQIPHSRMI